MCWVFCSPAASRLDEKDGVDVALSPFAAQVCVVHYEGSGGRGRFGGGPGQGGSVVKYFDGMLMMCVVVCLLVRL